MSTSQTFLLTFMREVLSNLTNTYTDNYDYLRFGGQPAAGRQLSFRRFVGNVLRRSGYHRGDAIARDLLNSLELVEPYLDRLQSLYDGLADQESRALLVGVLAFRCLGHRKVKLPLSTPDYWKDIQNLDQLADKSDSIQTDFHDWIFYRMNLKSIGFPIELYHTTKVVYTQFVLQQYRCKHESGFIQAEPGDFVIDAGACWGDTALYFAHLIGSQGRVFSFEFMPRNLEVFAENLALNPGLSERICLIDKAVWSASNQTVYYRDLGPGTVVSLEPLTDAQGQTKTLSIDDMVQQYQLQGIDFIKMDIEGAELQALRGATNTLKRFKPKLAISIYHRMSDFVDIPEFLTALDLGYRFYIRHLTIHAEETILFAESVCTTADQTTGF